jgi:hypothetical protein
MNNINFGTNVKGDLTKDNIKSGVPLYHRPKDSKSGDALAVINSLMNYGFSREYTGDNGGNMYGPGVYNVYTLRSSNESARGYGKYIVKSFLLGGYKDFLIFNEEMAKEVYGNEWPIDIQIKKLFPPKICEEIFRRFNVIGAKPYRRGGLYNIGNLYMNNNSSVKTVKTSVIAVQITDFLHSKIAQSKVRGIIYSGNHDGECAFVRNFSDVIPFYYSKDNGKTWIEGITDNLIWRAGHDTDVEATLKHSVDDSGKKNFSDTADRSINGFVLVYKDNGKKANYFEVATNSLISNTWFDYAGNFNEDGVAEVLYKGRNFFIAKVDDEEDRFIVGSDEEGPICYLKDLPIQELNETIFQTAVKEVINEAQNLVDNFNMVSNMLNFRSSDDFYFVQIIKRFKDNPNDDRTQGNYHAGGWYLKGYRVRSGDELQQLKPEIVKMCHDNNARAYITINSRSEQETNNFIKIYKKKFSSTDPRYIHADDIIPGQAKDGPSWKGQRSRLFLDVDVPRDAKCDGRNIWDEVRYMIDMVGIKPLAEYETPSGGLHIILPDKEDKRLYYLKRLFSKFDNWKYKGKLATVHPNVDGKIILYSNVQTKGY